MILHRWVWKLDYRRKFFHSWNQLQPNLNASENHAPQQSSATGQSPDYNLIINILKQSEVWICLLEDYTQHHVIDTEARRQIVRLCWDHLISVSEKRYYSTTGIKMKVAQSIVNHFACPKITEPGVSEYFSLYDPIVGGFIKTRNT